MSSILPPAVNDLIMALSRLPGVGPKSASRMAFYLLQKGKDDVEGLTSAIKNITGSLTHCSNCGLIADSELCPICADESRQEQQICVVEDSLDVVAFEKASVFSGKYHVLGGVLSPIDGVGPEQIRISQLVERVKGLSKGGEIILAVNPSLEGEATAEYINDQLSEVAGDITITRIARGLPMGSDVEYADPTTLIRALEGRREL